jgi:hypothetical protein
MRPVWMTNDFGLDSVTQFVLVRPFGILCLCVAILLPLKQVAFQTHTGF